MVIIGHRGAKGIAPENTLEAIQKAIELKVDAIEVDVRSNNGDLVLSHDPTIISESYALLSDAVKLTSAKIPLILDVKDDVIVEKLLAITAEFKGDIIYSSFKYSILQKIKTESPKSNIAIIEKWSGVRAVAEASLLKTKRVHINQQWLWSNFVASMKYRGFELYAYTVNSPERALELEKWGVDGIFTDYPNRFK